MASSGMGGETALDRNTIRSLRAAVGGAFSVLVEDRICYSFDATDLRSMPDAVAWPESTDQVAALVRAASAEGIPITARGAGTGYTGGSIPLAGGIVVSFEKMDRILSVDVRARLAVVQPGVVNSALRDEVQTLGLSYPPDPASLLISTIGGNIAEGAGGPRTVLHGTTRDYVAGLELVLADGSVVLTGVLAGDPGISWDPDPLVVASEGTLALVTKAALRLSDIPEAYATCWAEFRTLEDAAHAVAGLTATGLPVAVLEILDRDTLAAATEFVTGRAPVSSPEGALLVELEGRDDDVRAATGRLREELERHGAISFREASSEEEREQIWDIRRAISPSLARLSSGKINEDIAVPRSAIPSFVLEMREISRSCGLPILAFGHAGDGNLHVNVLLDRTDRDQMRRAREAVGRLFETALRMGGTLSGEHGIGITKADHLSEELDETAMGATAAVKRAFDPRGVLNPDKILTDRPNPWWKDLDAPEAGRTAKEESSEC